MRQKRLQLSALPLLGLGLTGLQAQTSINATGGNASGSGGSASYSVGQVVYTANTGTTGSVSQGVQQSYEITVISGIGVAERSRSISLTVTAYPNPTTDFLQLKVDASATLSIQSLSYQLFDMQGKLLITEKLTGKETQINMSSYVSSSYFVRIIQNNKEIKTFKIIKTKQI